jgi:CopG family nickel-responsive transcriptional regulator
MNLVRFGVSMEKDLLKQFDYSIEKKGYPNRSEAFRDLVRQCLLEKIEYDPTTSSIGVISFVYEHEHKDISRRLVNIGHSMLGEIISSLHIHIDAHQCMEVIVAKGTAEELKRLSDQILASKGVLHGQLMLSPLKKHH